MSTAPVRSTPCAHGTLLCVDSIHPTRHIFARHLETDEYAKQPPGRLTRSVDGGVHRSSTQSPYSKGGPDPRGR